MQTPDFSTVIRVNQTPIQVFSAINNVRGWWSEHITGNSSEVGDEFVFEVPRVHLTKQRITEADPGKRVIWSVTESRIEFVSHPDEWRGTRILFDIRDDGNETVLTFTHEGLVPSMECYHACSPAWTEYIQHSLYHLITTGKGDPNLEGKRISSLG